MAVRMRALMTDHSQRRTGLLYAFAAFLTWGSFPLYLQFVHGVPPLEFIMHRSVWALVFVVLMLTLMRHWAWLPQVLRQPRKLLVFVFTALLLSSNSLVYVYAVQTGHVLETSLGYFINPLISVLLGVMVLGEKLRRVQWVAVALAACGVAWLTWHAGKLPWMGLVLAVSFGVYGLVRKTAPLGAMEGMALENLLLAPVMLPALAWWTLNHGGVLAQGVSTQLGWLLLAGPLTALPLLWFAAAARRLPLATVGMVQYVSPSLQFVLAVWVLHEPFSAPRLLGFAAIWAALGLLSVDALGSRRRLALARAD